MSIHSLVAHQVVFFLVLLGGASTKLLAKSEDWLISNTTPNNLICQLAAYKISLAHTHVYIYSIDTINTPARHNLSLD